MIKLFGAVSTDVGNVRDVNQDRGFVSPNVYVVADGMGGHRGGEVAASLTVSKFVDAPKDLSKPMMSELAVSANTLVYERSEEDDLLGMGTTLVAIAIHSDQSIEVINVGDSRCYWLRDGYLAQVTKDHSFVEDLVEQNEITESEALTHPKRNIITRALGIAPDVDVDTFALNVLVGDRFMLCSDGLTDEVSEVEIVEIMTSISDAQSAADELVGKALENGGKDNVTVVVLDVLNDGESGNTKTVVVPSSGDIGYESEFTEDEVSSSNQSEDSSEDDDALEANSSGDTADEDKPGLTAKDAKSDLKSGSNSKTEDKPDLKESVVMAERGGLGNVAQNRRVRVLGFACLFVSLAAGYLFARGHNSNNWFLNANEEGVVSVYRGQPDGFLWFSPEQVSLTDINVTDLAPASLLELESATSFDSSVAATEFADTLVSFEASDSAEAVEEPEAETTSRTILSIDEAGE